jgi:hypothetical protein
MNNIGGRIKVDNRHKDIEYIINDNGCHEVISHASVSNGYNVIKMHGKVLDIHRWYYQEKTGIDLTGLVVRHKCDNRKCINLEHLEHGTQRDNVVDMFKRERGNAKLTIKEVKIIAVLIKEDYLTYLQIANLFDTNKKYISEIARGYVWQYITHFDIKPRLIQHAEKQSGEKYIIWRKHRQKWRFEYYHNDIKICKSFNTLDDAINYKINIFLQQGIAQ